MRMKFGRHHCDPIGVGLQGLMQAPVRFCGLLSPAGATLIQGPPQSVNIIIFTVFGLSCSEITQEAFFVFAVSTPKVRLGAAHTTADIRRVAGYALGRQVNGLFVSAEAEFKVDELVAYGTVIGIERQSPQQRLPGARWLQFTLDGGQGHEIVLPRLPTHFKDAQEVGLSLRIVPERLLALGQERMMRDIIGHEASP